ncbi:MAG TPA: DNA mismatch repair endonuclease MutL [Edaphocola sp.]|nr:DNA mismatch repair endonuclease MutL [Edaphocola sp.]
MSDIVKLLPDHLANQIAAGEVIQRPASAVKELIENAVDAGATSIQLVLKDAGKELIQVIDNGKGMSATDARMSFERHATSKITKIEDLFQIRTKGFRGEALASIAAVAQVTLKTKQKEETLGTLIEIESSNVIKQEPIAHQEGTSIAVRNLFYNVPARRHFLKSNTTELKHILDEFIRIALAHPDIAFKFSHNGVEQYNLPVGNLKQRILALLGSNMDKHLIPVDEDTEVLQIKGYIGKPQAATRTRGNQFFFINNRFIKSSYLNHAVSTAFEGLIAKETYPIYILFLEIDPARVDVNVHPTKQEVKFDDERIVYAYLQSAIKFALNKFNVAPSIDFTLDPDIQHLEALRVPLSTQKQEELSKGYLYQKFTQSGQAHFIDRSDERQQWKQQMNTFFPELPQQGLERLPEMPRYDEQPAQLKLMADAAEDSWDKGSEHQAFIQWNGFIVTTLKSGVLLIHLKRALERIIYERLSERLALNKPVTQQLLFPIEVSFNPADALLLSEVLSDLFALGFDIKPGAELHSFQVLGVPSDIPGGQEQQILEAVIDQLKHESGMLDETGRKAILRTMAKRMAVPQTMPKEQLQSLVGELFACTQAQYTPDGQLVFRVLDKDALFDLL